MFFIYYQHNIDIFVININKIIRIVKTKNLV